MRNRIMLTMALAGMLGLGSACGGGLAKGINVTLTPADTDINQALNVVITAVFDDDVEPPPDWYTAFTLKKNAEGDNLCTNIHFVSDTRTVTCYHDALEANTSYQTIITGVLTVIGKVATWTTVAADAQVLENDEDLSAEESMLASTKENGEESDAEIEEDGEATEDLPQNAQGERE